ncbi:hypothetical protein [Arhodomonas sp. AD133]|uniref:hypothetical protein n=1 Tax=Arhodomonas sp. AD133 TaxID=3415009 RepID=UPI003EBC6263
MNRERPGILHILHAGGGGLDAHVCELAHATSATFDHWLLRIDTKEWRLSAPADPTAVGTPIRVRWGHPFDRLCRALGVAGCHVHHALGWRRRWLRALASLRAPFGISVHDFSWICPRLHLVTPDTGYCAGPTDSTVCAQCLRREPRLDRAPRRWRRNHAAILQRARFVACPTAYVRDTLAPHIHDAALDVVPHEYRPPFRRASPPPPDGEITVALIGAMGPEKGGLRVEQLAQRTQAAGLPIRWIVIGNTIHHGGPRAVLDGALFVHGGYRREELPDLLADYGAHLVAFPAEGPETWSLTLDEAWACGRPALVPNLGALGERVGKTGAGWRISDWQTDEAWLAWLQWLLTTEGRDSWIAAAERACHAHDGTPTVPPVTRLYERFYPNTHRQTR